MNPEKKQTLSSLPGIAATPENTIVEVFERNCHNRPDKVLYYFLEDGLKETDRITYGQMNVRLKAIATELRSAFKKGDRALLIFPPGIEFIVSLFGCFYSGIIAVPAYPPRKNRMFQRFGAIMKDCSPSVILTTRKIKEDIKKNFSSEKCMESIDYLVYEDIPAELPDQWIPTEIFPDDLAFLQYTSGSTGEPNGVMVSHRNLVHNSEFIKCAFNHDENLVGVNWLPGFHDMGLIGALLQPAYVGGSNVIIPPNAFLLRPLNWLKAISNYRCTTAGGPNFALDHCVDKYKPEELEGDNLSCVQPFFCGAEPVQKKTLERFAATFGPQGFRKVQFYPCYGLAESVLIVTGGALNGEPVYCTVDSTEIEKGNVIVVPADRPLARTFVSCGYPWQGTKVAIVNPASNTVNPESMVGEIWVSGPSVAQGYWNKPYETEQTFRAYLSDTGEGPFLRTGDLGFINEGHLYITGRIKDLIIIRGLNHYPHDIEYTVGMSHEAIQQGAVAAFSVDEAGEERLAMACEIRRTHLRDLDPEQVFSAIRQAVADEHQLQSYAISLLRPGTIPKTSSGKIQRLKAKKEYLEEELDVVAEWKAEIEQYAVRSSQFAVHPSEFTEDQIQTWLMAWMVKELKIPAQSIDVTKPITAYGLDSLKAVVLARDAEDQFGIEWPLELFLEETTVSQLASKGIELLGR